MAKGRRTVTTEKSKNEITTQLDKIAARPKEGGEITKKSIRAKRTKRASDSVKNKSGQEEAKEPDNSAYHSLFDRWEEEEIHPVDYLEVSVDSLESNVGYSSLFRQMHKAFIRRVAFYKSPAGGSLSVEEAREKAFHTCDNAEEAKKEFASLMRLPLDCLSFADLMELQEHAPRVAERFWEMAKTEGYKEFASGHLSANIAFPEGYMKTLWNVARYLGVRESFVEDWNPSGAIELSMIDMLTQTYFQWQYWVEQTVRRSATKEREIHPEYSEWMAQRERENRANGWTEGYWSRPLVSEQQAIEHAVQMVDRWHRMYMRTIRQLRDLRRYSPVTINNAGQVNIAADGGQQVNLTEP